MMCAAALEWRRGSAAFRAITGLNFLFGGIVLSSHEHIALSSKIFEFLRHSPTNC